MLEKIWKVYAGRGFTVEALRGVSLQVEEGEFCVISGPSGSGKSTLLNMIGLLDNPTSGHIILDGVNVSRLEERRRTQIRNGKIGFIFQFFNLIPELNVLENVMLPSLMNGMVNSSVAKQEALSLLKTVGLARQAFQDSTRLSGGQMQRVAIARALINQPTLVLADEPTGNLDSKSANEIVNLMHELNKKNGQTFIMVTHAADLVGKVDRTITLKDGVVERMQTNSENKQPPT